MLPSVNELASHTVNLLTLVFSRTRTDLDCPLRPMCDAVGVLTIFNAIGDLKVKELIDLESRFSGVRFLGTGFGLQWLHTLAPQRPGRVGVLARITAVCDERS